MPDSSWFTNRIGTKPVTTDEITRGANVGAPPDPSKWVLIREKTSGSHPGFTARDAKGETWFLEFDPPYFAEGATGAVAIATKIFWALGYNQVESFLTTLDPKNTTIDPQATVRRPNGKRTAFTQDDINTILENVARNPDGTYRVIAGRQLPGKILFGYQYNGTRPDDPNDLVPHEHRRELRALRVFGAWTNLTDLKAANSLDTLITENGKSIVKHYLQDVGSTFGMCNDLHEWDLSYEYFLEGGPSWKRFFTLGFGLSPWQTVDYVEYPSVGKFEGKVFDPRKWRPQTPTVAYMEMRDDDAFWAARRVAAFTDELIRAAVHTGQFSNPEAEKYLADVLIQRREKIKSTYLTAVNPIVNPRLDSNGLTFENAAVAGGVAEGSVGYRASWMGSTTPPETRRQSLKRRARRRRLRRRAGFRRLDLLPSTSPPTAMRIPPGSSRSARTSARTAGAGNWWDWIGCPTRLRPLRRHKRGPASPDTWKPCDCLNRSSVRSDSGDRLFTADRLSARGTSRTRQTVSPSTTVLLRQGAGAWPTSFLNARLNAASDS